MVNSKRRSAWLIWALGAAFFLFEYITRVTPSVIATELMRNFHIYALGIGTLSGLFYYPYIGMQLPVGMLVDRFGPHKLLSIMALLCALGSYMFASADHILVADIGRFIIGFGASFAFVGSLKLATNWFPPQYFAFLAGMTQALGMLGASLGEWPMSILVKHTSWRHAIYYSSIGFLVLAVLIALIVRDKPAHSLCPKRIPVTETETVKHEMIRGLITVMKNPRTWIVAAYAGFIYASSAGFAELWGVSYLRHVFHLSNVDAAGAVGLIFVGWAIGAPIMGFLTTRLYRRPLLIGSAFCGLLVFLVFLIANHLSKPEIYTLTFLYGITNTGLIIAYAKSAHINGKNLAGTSLALTNMASVIVGALLQPILGWVIDLSWSGIMRHGVPLYTPHDFKVAISVFPICLLIAATVAFFGKKTFSDPFKYQQS